MSFLIAHTLQKPKATLERLSCDLQPFAPCIRILSRSQPATALAEQAACTGIEASHRMPMRLDCQNLEPRGRRADSSALVRAADERTTRHHLRVEAAVACKSARRSTEPYDGRRPALHVGWTRLLPGRFCHSNLRRNLGRTNLGRTAKDRDENCQGTKGHGQKLTSTSSRGLASSPVTVLPEEADSPRHEELNSPREGNGPSACRLRERMHGSEFTQLREYMTEHDEQNWTISYAESFAIHRCCRQWPWAAGSCCESASGSDG